MANEDVRKRSRRVAFWLVLSQLGYLISLIGWFAVTFLLANIYEGGATWQKNALFMPILVFPLVVLIASIIAWVAFARFNMKVAALTMLSPLAYALLHCGIMWAFWTPLFIPG